MWTSEGSDAHAVDRDAWVVLWCNGESYRYKDEDRRNLAEGTRLAGGRFNAIKKAPKLGSVLTKYVRQSPYVFVVDWRELKPCLHVIEDDQLPRPVGLIVLEEDTKLAQKAEAYVTKFPTVFPVVVTRDVGVAKAKAIAMVTEDISDSLGSPKQGGMADGGCTLSDFCRSTTTDTQENRSPRCASPVSSWSGDDSFPQDCIVDHAENCRHQQNVVTVLTAAVGNLDGAALEALLLNHLPEFYED